MDPLNSLLVDKEGLLCEELPVKLEDEVFPLLEIEDKKPVLKMSVAEVRMFRWMSDNVLKIK